jgi:RNA polymerase sigma-70 factor (ECF subfamily)
VGNADPPAARLDALDVRRARGGDPQGFEALVERHARRVHDLARRILGDAHEAEDATQQAFFNAWRALDRFDESRPFRNWILRITTNLCRNRLAARRVRRHELRPRGGDEEPPPDPRARDAVPLAAAPLGEELERALAQLPEAYRTVVVLRYLNDLSLEEIAEVLALPLGTVKTHLFRARAALRTLVPDPETPPPAGGTPK